jgi:3-hydroxyacyl-CoA dehydrogenase
MEAIRKVGVIGAGVMGAGIAAQVANAGVPVLLLDLVPDGAAKAVEKMLKQDPAPFMSKAAAKLVETGGTETDLARLADCDLIVEAIIERPDAKQALYRRLIEAAPNAAISSNTSTIPLAMLTAGLPDEFARRFLITHFFNPPRYMRLLEIVTGPRTDPAIIERVEAFADRVMGKTCVRCKDTPGFIANRLGTYWLTVAMVEALDAGLTVEEADAVIGRPMGVPKTGVFGLIDLVGLDLVPHVNASMARALPKEDAFHAANRDIPLIGTMIAAGNTGRKGKGGFYRLNRAGGAKRKEAIDLRTGEYRPERKAELPEVEAASRDLKRLLDAKTPAGRYAWRVLGQTLAYAAGLVPETADSPADVDAAMRLGYNWKWGPFELADRLGTDWLAARLEADGVAVPPLLALARGKTFYRVEAGRPQCLGPDDAYHDVPRPDGALLLSDVKLRGKPVLKNGSAALWDLGDGVACFEFTSKMNALDEGTITLLAQSIEAVRERFKALVIYNEGTNFSVGANLGIALFAANIAAWGEVEKGIEAGQKAYQALKYAPFPVVAAPAGMALGGGCEILLHSDAIQAHAELYAGLVETGVGLIPGWGGCKEMLARWQANPKLPRGPMPAPGKVFELVSTAAVSKSAAEARENGILRDGDRITMNRDRLLADAKARALELAEGYQPPAPHEFKLLPGESGALGMRLAAEAFQRRGIATPHDVTVAGALARVLSGGDADMIDTVTEQQVLDLEREAFMRLVRTGPTLARIEHTLETGKPLRN